MSLTDNDLQKIGDLIDTKLESKLEEKLESKFSTFEQKIDTKLESKFNEKLKPIKKSLKSIEKKLDLTIRRFDHDYNYHHRRLDALEQIAGVKPPDFVPLPN